MRKDVALAPGPRVALVALAALAAGCGTAEAPGAPSAAFEDDRGATRAATERAFSRWRSQGLERYRFRWQRTCFCTADLIAPAVVTVRDGVVVSAELAADGAPVAAADLERFETIDGVFGAILEAIREQAYLIRVRYHPERGYPELLFVDQDVRIADVTPLS